MNKNVAAILNFLKWLGVVVLAYGYSMFMLLLISFIFLNTFHYTITDMFVWSGIVAIVVGIVYPINKARKEKKKKALLG